MAFSSERGTESRGNPYKRRLFPWILKIVEGPDESGRCARNDSVARKLSMNYCVLAGIISFWACSKAACTFSVVRPNAEATLL